MDESFSRGRIDVSSVRVQSIEVEIGASKQIKPAIPAISLKVKTLGKIKADIVLDLGLIEGVFYHFNRVFNSAYVNLVAGQGF